MADMPLDAGLKEVRKKYEDLKARYKVKDERFREADTKVRSLTK